jgi:hypothetical protein
MTDRSYASGVFRDFVYATVLVDSPASAENDLVQQQLRSGKVLASPLIGPLIIEMLSSTEGATLDSDRCDILISSLQSYESRGVSFSYRVGAQNGGHVFELAGHSSSSQERPLTLPMYVSSSGLRLPPRCKNITVEFDGDVRLGFSKQAVVLGPAVYLRSGTLEVFGTEFIVDANESYSPVVVESELVLSTYPLNVKIFGPAFVLLSQEVEGPLRGYATEPEQPIDDNEVRDVFHALRRLLLYLRKTVHTRQGELAAQRDFLDRNLLSVNPIAKALMDSLMRDGVAYLEASHYVFRMDRLTQEGVNHLDVHSFNITPGLRSFLSRHAATD